MGDMLKSALFVFLNVAAVSCLPRYGICRMQPDPGASLTVTGNITFRQGCPLDPLEVTVHLQGFNDPGPGGVTLYGFHVHEFGDLSGGCASTGGHYNPFDTTHGAREDDFSKRHVGDFGNHNVTEGGVMDTVFTDYLASLFTYYSIYGRAMVIHSGVDDLGRGDNSASLSNGNAGSRLACCIIGVANEINLRR